MNRFLTVADHCSWPWSEWSNYDPDPIPPNRKKVCHRWQRLSASWAQPGLMNLSYVFFQNSQTICFPTFWGIQPAQKIKHHLGRSRRLESRNPKGWQCFIFKIQKWSNSLDFIRKSDFWNFADFAKCRRDIWHVRWQASRFWICHQKLQVSSTIGFQMMTPSLNLIQKGGQNY